MIRFYAVLGPHSIPDQLPADASQPAGDNAPLDWAPKHASASPWTKDRPASDCPAGPS